MSTTTFDRFETARAVADAVLYEGYVLYPYRASSLKNHSRWQFGVLTPRSYSERDGSERWTARTECLVAPAMAPTLAVRLRFLQVQRRTIEAAPTGPHGRGADFVTVERFEADDTTYLAWDEAVERTIDLDELDLTEVPGRGHAETFGFPAGVETEVVSRADGAAARIVRRREALTGRVLVQVSSPGGGRFIKVTVTVENTTAWPEPDGGREEALARSLVAVHTMLGVEDATFVSSIDPPEAAGGLAAECHNDGLFPVLIGGDEVVLSSPIILYDHPEVAPESPGDLYDATEIDEILALRVLAMSDGEKFEARATDPRAAAIVDRCDDLPADAWVRLHGAVRSLGPLGPPATSEADPGSDPEHRIRCGPVVGPGGRRGRRPVVGVGGPRGHRRGKGITSSSAAMPALGCAGSLSRRARGDRRRCVQRRGRERAGGGDRRFRPRRRRAGLAGQVPVLPPRGDRAARRMGPGPVSGGTLVAGIGNVFLTDDGFGVEVATRLAGEDLPSGVRVAEFGIRGVHLAYELLDGFDALVLVDAVPMGEPPGTLAIIEPDRPGADGGVVDAHTMSPDVVLATLANLGGAVDRINVVGCQPASLDEGMGLTPPVAAAVDGAMELCRQLMTEIAEPRGKRIGA